MKSIREMKLRYKAMILLGVYIIVCHLGGKYMQRDYQPSPQLQPPSQLECITDSNTPSPNEPHSPPPDVVRFLNRYAH